MTSQSGLQTIAIHILLNISQSKGHQTLKFGQLIEYNKINSSKIIPKMRQENLIAFFYLIFFTWLHFITWLLFFLEISINMCIAIVCGPGCDVINFEYNLIFLICYLSDFQAVFLQNQNVKTKTYISWKRNELLR